MDLSIIIVNWNSTAYLRNCLESVFRNTTAIGIEVIVVDNGSDDNSCAELIRTEFPAVVFHDSRENIGFARGSNLGYELSSGDILLFLNPDTEIHNNVFAHMAAELASHGHVGAIGSRLLNSDGSLQMSCVSTYPTIVNQLLDCEFLRTKFPASHLWGMQSLYEYSSQPAQVDVISGACLMVKRNVFEEIGKFDERFFMYVEDVDLCRRITDAGYIIRYMNACEVVHHGGKSSAVQGKYFANLRQQEAMLQFFTITKGKTYSFIYRVMLAVAAVIRLVIIATMLPLRKSRHAAENWSVGFEKWSLIFLWAIGFQS